ncbi:hypothetical protein PG991_008329 [Apiospora marii]|uniref:Heterokaryon incompatibility domain-containing protein n=1 Tax=Apiospora marii TaxID=335849 RepID=A0ABR1RSP0_9PEZI
MPDALNAGLLTILPDDDLNAAIRCSLKVVSLDDTSEFDALSYVWGDVDDCETIYVESESMLVTANLVAALRRLRPRPSHQSQYQAERVLWVDAICIDQGHTSEKSAQIPLMAQLYQQAKSVLAWLGEPTEAMEAAILWAEEFTLCSNDGGVGALLNEDFTLTALVQFNISRRLFGERKCDDAAAH